MEFAGITLEDSYASTLGDELGVPTKWPEECYVESLMKQNERRNKEASTREGRVEFVGGGKEGGESGSAPSAPKEGAAARKTKFDKQ